MALHRRLVRAHRRPVDRLLRPRGLRLRRRHAAAACVGRDRDRPPGRDQHIGPVWDGNEVWLLVAGGATFAAFPEWYATLFSGFYLALLLILVALIVRGWRSSTAARSTTRAGGAAGTARSSSARALPALLWGVAFANIVRGVPLDARPRVHRQRCSTCSTRTRCSAASTTLLAVHPARRVLPRAADRRRRARARQRARRRLWRRPSRRRRGLRRLDAAPTPTVVAPARGRWRGRRGGRARRGRRDAPRAAGRAGRSRSRR